jgi:hypothetical protein
MLTTRLSYVALAAVILIGIALRAKHVFDPHVLTPNERIFLYDAQRIHNEGIGVTRILFAEFRNDPGLWPVAQPVRIGYILTLAAAMEITGTTTVQAGMALNFATAAGTLLLLAWMGIRFFNRWVAVIACAFCTTAFTEIWLVRGTPQDGVVGLVSLIQIWITFELLRNPARWWLYIPFHSAGILGTLMKQAGPAVYGFTTIFLLAFLWFRERDHRRSIILAACSVGGLAVVALTYVLLAGDPQTAWRVYLLSYVSNPEGWSYTEDCCFGPYTQIPLALFYLSPLTFCAWVIGMGVLAIPVNWGSPLTRLQQRCGWLCAMVAIGFVCLFSLLHGWASVRYLTPGQGAACLVAAIGVWAVLSFLQERLARTEYAAVVALVIIGFIIGGVRDYRVFEKVGMNPLVPELGPALIRYALGV